jgi:hypothetical protein
MSKWYIDSLDALGGRAFASWREPDPDGALATAERTFFACAPDFTAEPVASRSVALSASRGTFQRGFLIDGEEYGFERVEHVIDFVRRVFLGGSGGNGSPGLLLPPTETGGGVARSHERSPSEGPGAGEALANAFSKFKWSSDGPYVYAFSWVELLDEHNVDARYSPNIESWTSALFEVLHSVFGAEPGDRSLWAALSLLERLSPADPRVQRMALDQIGMSSRTLDQWYWRGPFWARGSLQSPFDAASNIPVPRQWLPEVGPLRLPSLADFLLVTLAAPGRFPNESIAAELLLLLAAALCYDEWANEPNAGDNIKIQIALNWLTRHLPHFVFERRIEGVIDRSPSLRYASQNEGEAAFA